MRRHIALALLLALTLLIASPACAARDTGTVTVVRVVDGDTIDIAGGFRLRYIGMDSPEVGQPYYAEATEANRKMVQGRTVRLESDVSDKDRYGRLLRYVYVDGDFVNLELVRMGWAVAKSYPPDTKYHQLFEGAERDAKLAHRGQWAQ